MSIFYQDYCISGAIKGAFVDAVRRLLLLDAHTKIEELLVWDQHADQRAAVVAAVESGVRLRGELAEEHVVAPEPAFRLRRGRAGFERAPGPPSAASDGRQKSSPGSAMRSLSEK